MQICWNKNEISRVQKDQFSKIQKSKKTKPQVTPPAITTLMHFQIVSPETNLYCLEIAYCNYKTILRKYFLKPKNSQNPIVENFLH